MADRNADTQSERRRGFFERVIAPKLVARACGCGLCTRQRQRVVPDASGCVVEFGIGAGYNLPLYDRDRVTDVIGVEPDPSGNAQAEARAQEADIPLQMRNESAEATGLETGVADTLVTTYTLCTIPDLAAALGEAQRLLKPGGRLLFCEHGRAEDPRTARWQDRVNPWWRPLAGGCNLNRDISGAIASAGFSDLTFERYVPRGTPAIVATHYVGAATR
ncbi:MAG: class I SAM-dependent methyltransferase [Pseudomonadota bacterium]